MDVYVPIPAPSPNFWSWQGMYVFVLILGALRLWAGLMPRIFSKGDGAIFYWVGVPAVLGMLSSFPLGIMVPLAIMFLLVDSWICLAGSCLATAFTLFSIFGMVTCWADCRWS